MIFIISFAGSKGELIENLEIPVGVGTDIKKSPVNTIYDVPILTYTFEEGNKVTSSLIHGEASTIGETREDRQLKSSKRFLLGLNRLFVFSEETARNGIKPFIDICFNNPEINDKAVCIICKGTASHILEYKPKGYNSSVEYIEGMVKNLRQFNFFPMEYSIIDIILRMDAEGRTALLPYVEIDNEGLKTTGLAIFDKDKMVAKTNMEETRIINILKENNVKGTLTLKQNSKQYINFYATSKRKIKCSKENGKYKFIINLKINGDIINNELYKNMYQSKDKVKKFENDMNIYVEKLCNSSINTIKNEYKIDVLDLGRVAAAKYGKNKNIDWNKVVSNSDIKVNVSVKVANEGRGDY